MIILDLLEKSCFRGIAASCSVVLLAALLIALLHLGLEAAVGPLGLYYITCAYRVYGKTSTGVDYFC